MMKGQIIIIGANKFQNQLVEKANEMGYGTHVFAWDKGAVAKEVADYFYPISIREKEKILEIAREINPVAVVSVGSDLAVPTVNYIANELELIGNSNYSAKVSTNKYEMRKIFKKNNLPCPDFQIIDSASNYENMKINFPLVVKPIDRSGSRGIYKASNYRKLKAAIRNALDVSFSNQVLVEEYVKGKEYSLELISFQGEHYFLAITEKFTSGAPYFVEEAHLQPARIEENLKKRVIKIIKKALDVLDIKYGASHSEVKIDNEGNINIIEIGARMGGDFIGSDLVKISTGYDLLKMIIKVAVGKKPVQLKEEKTVSKVGLIKWIFSEEDLKLLKRIERDYTNNIFRIGSTEKISNKKIKDSSQRCGYFIIQGKDIQECLGIVGLKNEEE